MGVYEGKIRDKGTMSEEKYWVWFHRQFNSSLTGERLLANFGNVKALYEYISQEKNGRAEQKAGGYFTLSQAEAVCELCEKEGWLIITRESPVYPELLRPVKNSPAVLFADGNAAAFSERPSVTVVGSRKASAQGRTAAYNAGAYLAENGICVISGAADGIDLCAHKGALSAGGFTAAVLGCGLEKNSLKSKNAKLYEKIKQNGIFLTELLPCFGASRFSFPKRNRILAGLSRAVLTVEAGEKSGALITAENAMRQGRRVFACSPDLIYSDGCAKLIGRGAYPIDKTGDIIFYLKKFFPFLSTDNPACIAPLIKNIGLCEDDIYEAENIKKQKKNQCVKAAENTGSKSVPCTAKDLSGLSCSEKKVLYAFGSESLYIDDICEKTGLSVREAASALTVLELEDFVVSVPGGRFSKIN